MSNKDLIKSISSKSDQYTRSETGSRHVLKDSPFLPWEPHPQNPEGRYNGPGTGSLYLSDTLETCECEVRIDGKVAYKVNVDKMGLTKVLDLQQWSIDNPEYSGSLLTNSGSGGWEPTREIGDWAYGEGYQGIRYLSQYGNNRVNLLIYRDRACIRDEFFENESLKEEDIG